MTAHELARKLLEGPDLPVTLLHGYHAAEYGFVEVQSADEMPAILKKTDDRFYKVAHITLGGSPWEDTNSDR